MLPLSRQPLTTVSEGTPAPHTTQQRPIPYGSCSVTRVWVQAGSKQKVPHCSACTCQGWGPTHLEGRLDGTVQGAQGLLISIGCHCHYQVQDGESAAEKDTQLVNSGITTTARPSWNVSCKSHQVHNGGTAHTGQCPSAAHQEHTRSFTH